jgi:hypothetical protein
MSLIKPYMWGRTTRTQSIRTAHLPLSFLPLPRDPTETEDATFFPIASYPFADSISSRKQIGKMEESSIGNEILQTIYRWKALDEENPLKQLIFKMVYCVSLALEKKGIGQKMELAVWDGNEANWRLEKHCVGPTILLRRLLAWINSPLYYFHSGIGVQNHGQYKGVRVHLVFKKKEQGKLSNNHNAMSPIQTSNNPFNKHKLNWSQPSIWVIKGWWCAMSAICGIQKTQIVLRRNTIEQLAPI